MVRTPLTKGTSLPEVEREIATGATAIGATGGGEASAAAGGTEGAAAGAAGGAEGPFHFLPVVMTPWSDAVAAAASA